MFVDFAGSLGRNFRGSWYRYIVLQCQTIHLLIIRSWERKFKGKDNQQS